jgi:hypothetical protein
MGLKNDDFKKTLLMGRVWYSVDKVLCLDIWLNGIMNTRLF